MDMNKLKKKFCERVNKNTGSECWEWVGSISSNGYGKYLFEGKFYLAHRLSYMLLISDIPKNKLVLHKCDNPKCVNPKHLYVGTQKDNMQDKVRRGRMPCMSGENSPSSKLTWKKIEQAKKLSHEGSSLRSIGKMFNVHHWTIGLALKGKTWRSKNESKQ
jgi:hypothetical protein